MGCTKQDINGNEIAGVTATSVKEILPMHHGEILKVSMLINDDELDKETREAGMKVNGHLMHQFKDSSDDLRWSFYRA